MESKKPKVLIDLLPSGSITAMAKEAGVSKQAVGQALRKGKPTNRFVQQALKIAKECGSLETAQALASINA